MGTRNCLLDHLSALKKYSLSLTCIGEICCSRRAAAQYVHIFRPKKHTVIQDLDSLVTVHVLTLLNLLTLRLHVLTRYNFIIYFVLLCVQ